MAEARVYSTGQIARATGVHVNTIRMYEAQGRNRLGRRFVRAAGLPGGPLP